MLIGWSLVHLLINLSRSSLCAGETHVRARQEAQEAQEAMGLDAKLGKFNWPTKPLPPQPHPLRQDHLRSPESKELVREA